MNRYTETLVMTLPYSLEMAEIAAKIGRALDPDLGGDRSWARPIVEMQGETPVFGDTLECSTPCVAEFKGQVDTLLATPAMLHAVICADYAARWPEHVPPTLAEVELFTESLGVLLGDGGEPLTKGE